MPQVILRYNRHALSRAQIHRVEDDLIGVVAGHLGAESGAVTMQAVPTSARRLGGSDVALEVDGADSDRLAADIEDLFKRYGLEQHQIYESQELLGVRTIEVRTAGLSRDRSLL